MASEKRYLDSEARKLLASLEPGVMLYGNKAPWGSFGNNVHRNLPPLKDRERKALDLNEKRRMEAAVRRYRELKEVWHEPNAGISGRRA